MYPEQEPPQEEPRPRRPRLLSNDDIGMIITAVAAVAAYFLLTQ